MTKEEQARYYEEADRQRQLHKQLYPEWSNGENYVGSAEAHHSFQEGHLHLPSLSLSLPRSLSVF